MLRRRHSPGKTIYARDDAHKDALLKKEFPHGARVDLGRFKSLGEMMPAQLRETTKPDSVARRRGGRGKEVYDKLVESLMGRKPELRLAFIQERAQDAADLDI